MGYDLGPLTVVVDFSFLNFSVIVFLLCVALMVAVSKVSEKPLRSRISDLVFDWSRTRIDPNPAEDRRMTIATGLVACVVLVLWHHFR
jgi:hypothetical protein